MQEYVAPPRPGGGSARRYRRLKSCGGLHTIASWMYSGTHRTHWQYNLALPRDVESSREWVSVWALRVARDASDEHVHCGFRRRRPLLL